jgi:hypothetical protein
MIILDKHANIFYICKNLDRMIKGIQVWNNILPPKGYKAIALFPFIFLRNKTRGPINEFTINHERIHLAQQVEMLLVFFYILYIWYIIVGLFRTGNYVTAYKTNPFELEANINEDNLDYLKERKFWAWRKYKSK